MSGSFGGFGNLPKYQDLFVNKPKLPPLPPLPKYEPPKVETITKPGLSAGINKPLFVNQVSEVKIPQPPQLAKKSKPIVEPSVTVVKPANDKTEKPEENKTLDYDKLFGIGIV